jgi:putative copper resistance protein D
LGGEAPGGLLIAATALANIGLAIAVGALASRGWLEAGKDRAGSSAWAERRCAHAASLERLAAAWALTSALLVLWTQSAAIAEAPFVRAAPAVAAVVARTHVGHASLLEIAALLGLLVSSLRTPRPGAGRSAARLCVGLALAARADAGHAGATAALLPVAIDALHLLATSLWSGCVLAAVLVALGGAAPADALDRHAASRYVVTLSRTATWALGALVATGAYNSFIDLGGSWPAISSPYGAIWSVKVALVALAVGLGALNRWRSMPRLLAAMRSPAAPIERELARFRAVARIEAGILLAVLVAAAALSTSAPLGGPS